MVISEKWLNGYHTVFLMVPLTFFNGLAHFLNGPRAKILFSKLSDQPFPRTATLNFPAQFLTVKKYVSGNKELDFFEKVLEYPKTYKYIQRLIFFWRPKKHWA